MTPELSVKVEEELRSIPRPASGVLSPEAVVAWAKHHKRSRLYADLVAHARTATEQAMLARADRLIRLYILKDPRTNQRIEIRLGPTGKDPDGGARPVAVVIKSQELMKIAYDRAISELRSVRERYDFLSQLDDVWRAIAKAVEEHDEEAKS